MAEYVLEALKKRRQHRLKHQNTVYPMGNQAAFTVTCRALPNTRRYGMLCRGIMANLSRRQWEGFEEKMARRVAALRKQQAEAGRLDEAIKENLMRLGYGE